MHMREHIRKRNNKKVHDFAKKILSKCEDEHFSLADMKDLANILPDMIGETILLIEENQVFKLLSDGEESQNSNADTHLQNSENHLQQ